MAATMWAAGCLYRLSRYPDPSALESGSGLPGCPDGRDARGSQDAELGTGLAKACGANHLHMGLLGSSVVHVEALFFSLCS